MGLLGTLHVTVQQFEGLLRPPWSVVTRWVGAACVCKGALHLYYDCTAVDSTVTRVYAFHVQR